MSIRWTASAHRDYQPQLRVHLAEIGHPLVAETLVRRGAWCSGFAWRSETWMNVESRDLPSR